VKVTSDDAVKILDFGLAKTMQAETASGDAITSPTLSQMATQAARSGQTRKALAASKNSGFRQV
jgi:hypothetical protein